MKNNEKKTNVTVLSNTLLEKLNTKLVKKGVALISCVPMLVCLAGFRPASFAATRPRVSISQSQSEISSGSWLEEKFTKQDIYIIQVRTTENESKKCFALLKNGMFVKYYFELLTNNIIIYDSIEKVKNLCYYLPRNEREDKQYYSIKEIISDYSYLIDDNIDTTLRPILIPESNCYKCPVITQEVFERYFFYETLYNVQNLYVVNDHNQLQLKSRSSSCIFSNTVTKISDYEFENNLNNISHVFEYIPFNMRKKLYTTRELIAIDAYIKGTITLPNTGYYTIEQMLNNNQVFVLDSSRLENSDSESKRYHIMLLTSIKNGCYRYVEVGSEKSIIKIEETDEYVITYYNNNCISTFVLYKSIAKNDFEMLEILKPLNVFLSDKGMEFKEKAYSIKELEELDNELNQKVLEADVEKSLVLTEIK